jgi:hypothetical protein
MRQPGSELEGEFANQLGFWRINVEEWVQYAPRPAEVRKLHYVDLSKNFERGMSAVKETLLKHHRSAQC